MKKSDSKAEAAHKRFTRYQAQLQYARCAHPPRKPLFIGDGRMTEQMRKEESKNG